MDNIDEITGLVIGEAIEVHRELGPGLLESVYETVLGGALSGRGLKVERQKPIPFVCRGMAFDEGFRVDLLVEDLVVLELKSVERLAAVHSRQLLTYLKLARRPVGLLLNFGAPVLRDGIHRVVNNLNPSASPRLRVNQSWFPPKPRNAGGAST